VAPAPDMSSAMAGAGAAAAMRLAAARVGKIFKTLSCLEAKRRGLWPALRVLAPLVVDPDEIVGGTHDRSAMLPIDCAAACVPIASRF
jgi:hypothetical protein